MPKELHQPQLPMSNAPPRPQEEFSRQARFLTIANFRTLDESHPFRSTVETYWVES